MRKRTPARRGLAHRLRGDGGVRVVGVGAAGGGHHAEAGLHVGVGDVLQVLAGRAEGAEGGQAPLRVMAMLSQVLLDQCVEQLQPHWRELALFAQDLPQGPRLVQHPGVHGRDQGVPADEVHLQGQDAEQQVAVSVRSGHGAAPVNGIAGCRGLSPAGSTDTSPGSVTLM
jgi:hypothetical protein